MQNGNENTLNNIKMQIGEAIKSLNSTTACFTGYCNQKLPWKFDEVDIRCIKMQATLRLKILEAIFNGYKTFLCGMALGFDMLCTETLLDLKKRFRHIRIIGALPCKNQDIKWSPVHRKRYRRLLRRLDGIRCIYGDYIGAECMMERNRYMVNKSSLLIALFDGKSGETKSTIEYAREQGLRVVIIEP